MSTTYSKIPGIKSAIRPFKAITLDELIARVEQDNANKKDREIPAFQELRVNNQFRLTSREVLEAQLTAERTGQELSKKFRGLDMTDNALGQLCAKVGVPTQFVKRILATKDVEAIAKIADLTNFFAAKLPAKPGLCRVRVGREDGALARAILSDRYAILDNTEVVQAIRALDGMNFVVQPPVLTEDYFSVRLVLPDIKYKVGQRGDETDWVMGMVQIANSETGSGSLSVRLMIFRLVCLNGMTTSIVPVNMRKSHIGSAKDLREMFYGAINEVPPYVEAISKRFAASHEVVVEDPMEEIRQLCESIKLSKEKTEKVLACFLEDEEDSVFGVTNAFTLAAQEWDAETRVQVETFAGDYVISQTRDLLGPLTI